MNKWNRLREEPVKRIKSLHTDSLESDMLSLFDSDIRSIDTEEDLLDSVKNTILNVKIGYLKQKSELKTL